MPAARAQASQKCASLISDRNISVMQIYRVAHTSGEQEYEDLGDAQAAVAKLPGARLFVYSKSGSLTQ